MARRRLHDDGDAVRLQQVVSNLLGNAVRDTPSGKRVEVAMRTEPDRVEITVRDTGMGIDPAMPAGPFPPRADTFLRDSVSENHGRGSPPTRITVVSTRLPETTKMRPGIT